MGKKVEDVNDMLVMKEQEIENRLKDYSSVLLNGDEDRKAN